MEQLKELLNKLLAESFALYVKAQFYHWNVTGPEFPQYHEFFGDLYEEVQGSIDTTAEELRAIGGTPVGSFAKFIEMSAIKDETSVPELPVMVSTLYQENLKVIDTLNKVFKVATQMDEQGLVNYIADRIDIHKKHSWMLKSSLSRNAVEEEKVKVYELKIEG